MSPAKRISDYSPEEWEQQRQSMLQMARSRNYLFGLIIGLVAFTAIIAWAWIRMMGNWSMMDRTYEIVFILAILSLGLVVLWLLTINTLIQKWTKKKKRSR